MELRTLTTVIMISISICIEYFYGYTYKLVPRFKLDFNKPNQIQLYVLE